MKIGDKVYFVGNIKRYKNPKFQSGDSGFITATAEMDIENYVFEVKFDNGYTCLVYDIDLEYDYR